MEPGSTRRMVASVTWRYRHIVADYRRQYPHEVKLAHAGDWRARHCTHKAREIMPGPVVQWFEGHGDRLWVYGFKTEGDAVLGCPLGEPHAPYAEFGNNGSDR